LAREYGDDACAEIHSRESGCNDDARSAYTDIFSDHECDRHVSVCTKDAKFIRRFWTLHLYKARAAANWRQDINVISAFPTGVL
jgi:hypothetical protein